MRFLNLLSKFLVCNNLNVYLSSAPSLLSLFPKTEIAGRIILLCQTPHIRWLYIHSQSVRSKEADSKGDSWRRIKSCTHKLDSRDHESPPVPSGCLAMKIEFSFLSRIITHFTRSLADFEERCKIENKKNFSYRRSCAGAWAESAEIERENRASLGAQLKRGPVPS